MVAKFILISVMIHCPWRHQTLLLCHIACVSLWFSKVFQKVMVLWNILMTSVKASCLGIFTVAGIKHFIINEKVLWSRLRVTPLDRPQAVFTWDGRAFSQSLSKCDPGSNSGAGCYALPRRYPLFQPYSSLCVRVCTRVLLCLLHLNAFALLYLFGTESWSRPAAGEVCHCNSLPSRPNGHSHPLSCPESAREQFLNQTEHCCTGYPWWLNLDSCRPTA